MIKLKILVVLYNKLPNESQTLNSFISYKEELSEFAEIIIWDNSINYLSANESNQLRDTFNPLNIEYIASGKNVALSVIYNTVIKKLHTDEYFVIFDHDSTVDFLFFVDLIDSISKNNTVNLFLPIVISNNYIVSPANTWYFMGWYWKKPKYGKIRANGITAINSGMVINGNYLNSKFKGYDEDLKFYETDNDFMYKYSLDNEYLFVLKSKIDHSLNYYEKSTLNDKLFRYKSAKEGCLIHIRKRNRFIYLLALIYFSFMSIRLTIKHRSFRFLFTQKN